MVVSKSLHFPPVALFVLCCCQSVAILSVSKKEWVSLEAAAQNRPRIEP